MPISIEKEDSRSVKTAKALDDAMSSLLEERNFRKITVKDISDEALISRATFYTHFTDKYDLLKAWIIAQKPEGIGRGERYEIIEQTVNQLIDKNAIIIKNLLHSADDETLAILFDFILSTLALPDEQKSGEKTNSKYVVFSTFYAGGMFNYFLWQVKNKFPADVAPMNVYFYEIIAQFRNWMS